MRYFPETTYLASRNHNSMASDYSYWLQKQNLFNMNASVPRSQLLPSSITDCLNHVTQSIPYKHLNSCASLTKNEKEKLLFASIGLDTVPVRPAPKKARTKRDTYKGIDMPLFCCLCLAKETAQWRYLYSISRVCNKCFMKFRKRKMQNGSNSSRSMRASKLSFANKSWFNQNNKNIMKYNSKAVHQSMNRPTMDGSTKAYINQLYVAKESSHSYPYENASYHNYPANHKIDDHLVLENNLQSTSNLNNIYEHQRLPLTLQDSRDNYQSDNIVTKMLPSNDSTTVASDSDGSSFEGIHIDLDEEYRYLVPFVCLSDVDTNPPTNPAIHAPHQSKLHASNVQYGMVAGVPSNKLISEDMLPFLPLLAGHC